MEPATTTATSTAIPVVGYDVLTPLLQFIFGDSGVIGFLSLDGVLGFLGGLWTVIVVIGYIVAAFLLYFYIYAVINVGKLLEQETAERVTFHEQAFKEKQGGGTRHSEVFASVRQHIDSFNPNDWKLAIIECDILLDKALQELGYAGTTLGERLRSVSPTAVRSLDDAWQAHRIRNQIAHEGADFVLTSKLARETVVQYERVLTELGVI
jgi:uncharacterized membrane protein